MSKTLEGQKRWQQNLMPNYGTPNLVLAKGQGATVWDVDGKEYVDFLAGIAVNIVGHAHPYLVETVTKQMQTLGHTSNFAAHEPGLRLAERLLELTGRDGKVFFCNSGAEANESGIKVARKTGRTGLIALNGSFHGRTMGALSMTGQPKKQDPFRPLLPDAIFVAPNDIDELNKTVTNETSAFWYEPISGEGGVLPLTHDYLVAAEKVCKATGTLLVDDEVQTGIARTGTMFAYQQVGIEPDVLLLAKGLGGGIPIGACIAFGEYADLLEPGSHGSTFGGNAVSCAAGNAVLDLIEKEDLLTRAKYIGEVFQDRLGALDAVKQVRGTGAMQGVVFHEEIAAKVEARGRELGVITNVPLPNVLRLVPPLAVTDSELEKGITLLSQAIQDSANL